MANIMTKNAKKTGPSKIIAQNRKARHDYALEQQFEAGLVLHGWEAKSLRAQRVQLKDSYVVLRDDEAWLINANFSPLKSTCTYTEPDPERSRKLLLHRHEINKLRKAREAQGYTIVPLDLHWSKRRAKLTIALAKGKREFDKRETEKKRDWDREKQRLLKR